MKTTKDIINTKDIIEDLFNEDKTPTAIAIIKNNILYKRVFGNINEDKSVQTNTRFQIASLTKLFTAAMILKLHQDKKLNIRSKTNKYSNKVKNTTIWNLLNHTAGPRELINEIYCYTGGYHEEKYSNMGYNLLGIIIEEITGISYENYLIEVICKPLGMTNTGISDYDIDDNYINGNYDNYPTYKGASEIYSTIDDMIKFTTNLLQNNILELLLKIKNVYIGNYNDYSSFLYIDEKNGFSIDSHVMVST